MNRTSTRWQLSSALILALGATAQSAVISMDLNQPGDGLLTYDTINHRQWLDLSQTEGWSQAQTKQAILPGGVYQGFHVATVDEVTAFVSSAGYVGTTQEGDPYFAIATKLVDLLNQNLWYLTTATNVGTTRFDNSLPTGSWSLLVRYADAWAANNQGAAPFEDFTIYTWASGMANLPADPSPPIDFISPDEISFAGTQADDPTSFTYPARAFWLYRDVPVPEPATATLLIFAIGATALIRIR